MSVAVRDLSRLIAPRRIALIGSLSKPTGFGSRTLKHLQGGGFDGEILTLTSPAELDGEVDVAVIAVPAKAVAEVLAELDGRCQFAIVNSSGFEEVGDEPLPQPSSTTLIGPNSVGMFYAPSSTTLTFAAAFDKMAGAQPDSGIFMISQSGAFGARLVQMADHYGVGFSGFLGTGNETHYGACRFARDLIRLDEQRPSVIALYLENVADGSELDEMLSEAADAGVGVVVLLGGSSASGAAAASSHTAAVSPDFEIVRELCTMRGGVFAESDRDLVEAAIGLARLPKATGRRIGVVTGSGGAGVVAADMLSNRGLELPTLSDELQARLRERLPSYAATPNPVDVTAQVIGDNELIGALVGEIAASGEVDAVCMIGRREQAPPVTAAAKGTVPAVVTVLDGTPDSVADELAARQPVLPGLAATAAVLRAVCTVGDASGSAGLGADPPPGLPSSTGSEAAASLDAVSAAGVKTAPWKLVRSAAEAHAAGAALGWPVVIKANLPADTHKALHGGVKLDVTESNIDAVSTEMLERAPELIVASQLRGGPELVVGIRRDAVFGPIVVAGLGGGHIELMARTVSLPISTSPGWLAQRLREVVFDQGGERYAQLARQLADTAQALAALFEAGDYELIECNPLIPSDGALVALDARVVTHV